MNLGKLKSFLGAGAGSTSSETESETPAAGDGQTDGAKGAKEDAAPEIDAPKKKAPVKDTIPLQVTLKSAPSLSMSKAEKRSARDRCVSPHFLIPS